MDMASLREACGLQLVATLALSTAMLVNAAAMVLGGKCEQLIIELFFALTLAVRMALEGMCEHLLIEI